MPKTTKATLTAKIAELEKQLAGAREAGAVARGQRDEYYEAKNKLVSQLHNTEYDHRLAMNDKDTEIRDHASRLAVSINCNLMLLRRFALYSLAIANPETAKDSEYIKALQHDVTSTLIPEEHRGLRTSL